MKHSLIRQNIIETASQLFYNNGYNLTGINEIIKEAGIAKATLYSHFGSKEAICIAYLEYKNNTFMKEIERYCTKAPKGKKQLLAIFDYLKQFFKDKDFNGCWCIRTVSEIPSDNKNIRAEIQEQKQQLIKFIQDLLKDNKLTTTTKQNKTLAKQIYMLYEGAVSESHLHQEPWPILSAKELCAKVLE